MEDALDRKKWIAFIKLKRRPKVCFGKGKAEEERSTYLRSIKN